MSEGYPTHRHAMFSVFQSAIDALIRRHPEASHELPAQRPPAATALRHGPDRPARDHSLIHAVAAYFQHAGTPPSPEQPPKNVHPKLWIFVHLAYDYVRARIAGDLDRAHKIRDMLTTSEIDPGWLETITSHLDYFGADGTRRAVPYVRPAMVGRHVLPLPGDDAAGCRVLILGDWGTGTAAARDLLEAGMACKPDVILHLGDIYYSGTHEECERNFRLVLEPFRRLPAGGTIPVYTLAGNHDMYSGGRGYYELLGRLNPPACAQRASFFCLRGGLGWQFVALDTGLNDHVPFDVDSVVTEIEPDEEDWADARIREFPGRTILLSHHQLFSRRAQIGPPASDGSLMPYNPRLLESFNRFKESGRIAAWYWGHEHALGLYEPYLGLARGRCVGHGAVPVAKDDSDALAARMQDPPTLLPQSGLDRRRGLEVHGFTVLTLGAGTGVAEYFEFVDGKTVRLFQESLVD